MEEKRQSFALTCQDGSVHVFILRDIACVSINGEKDKVTVLFRPGTHGAKASEVDYEVDPERSVRSFDKLRCLIDELHDRDEARRIFAGQAA